MKMKKAREGEETDSVAVIEGEQGFGDVATEGGLLVARFLPEKRKGSDFESKTE